MNTWFEPQPSDARGADMLLAPGTIAGLLDGDGSLALLGRGQGLRRRYVPHISYVVRDDDPTPATVAASVAQLHGDRLGHVRHYPSQRDLGWWVGAVPEVVAVTRLLTRAPLLSPRGSRQASAVREAALLLANGRPLRSATEPLPLNEVERLRELHDGIPRASGRNDKPLPLPEEFLDVDDRYLGDYLAGFAAAEGSFDLSSSGTHYYSPRFRLTQRIDNLALLEALVERLGIGRVVPVRVSIGAPAYQWVVDDVRGVERLTELLRGHPLPPGSPKARAFEYWAEGTAARRVARIEQPRGALRRHRELAALQRELRGTRTYIGPCWQPSRGLDRTVDYTMPHQPCPDPLIPAPEHGNAVPPAANPPTHGDVEER